MISWLRVFWDTLKVFVLFVGCTVLFYYGLMWIDHEYESYHKYDKPKGRAVKVYQVEENKKSFDWLNRLELFYKIGE
ncbi:MAG TPA: YqzK family protein [Bacillales bacterium]